MKYITYPFPNDDGTPASYQDIQDIEQSRKAAEQSERTANEYMKMILSTMK